MMKKTAQDPKALAGLDREDAIALLRHYFGRCACASPDSGASFERIGHPWDKKSKANTVSPGDLVALATLSAPVPGAAAVWMLDPHQLKKSEKLLRKIPITATIGSKKGAALLSDGGPAARLRDHWLQAPGLGPVSTSKLLARKRANLVPVYDSVVAKQLEIGGSGEQWTVMQQLFAEEHHGLWATAKQWRRAAGVARFVSPLRVVDIVLGQHGRYPNGPPCDLSAA